MKQMDFESALHRLEEIVSELESGQCSLEESLQFFEEGIRMSRICAEKLAAAKQKIQQLVRSEDGTFKVIPWNDEIARQESD